MTDYLTTLASRALGVALTAQPVLPSIFAPQSSSAQLTDVETGSGWEDVAGLAVDGLSSAPRLPKRQATSHPTPPWFAALEPPTEETAPLLPSQPNSAKPQSDAGPTDSRGQSRPGDVDSVTDSVQPDAPLPAARPAGIHARSLQTPTLQRSEQAAEHTTAVQAPSSVVRAELSTSPNRPEQAARPTSPGLAKATDGAQRAVGDGVDRSAVAPAVAPTTASAALPATPQVELSAIVTVESPPVLPPTSESTPDRVDLTTQLRVTEAIIEAPWQNTEAGAAPVRTTAFGLLLPLESEQASGSRLELAARVPAPRETSPSPAPAPIIEVTIGRVEVRSVQAERPATKPRAATPAPPLSLEAYLRQQQGSQP